MPSIRSIARYWRVAVVFAAAAASSATSILCETVDRIENRTLYVSESDPEHRDALEACLNEDARCERLCDDLLGAPEPGYTRTIRECYLVESGGGYRVETSYRLVGPCEQDYTPDAARWFPDAEQHDATPVWDATPDVDAIPAPPDAAL